MATKSTPPKKAPKPAGAAYYPSSFAKLAQAQALTMKIQEAKAFEFSEQTRAALDQARAEPTLENLGVACALAAAELEGQPSLGGLVKTLSLAIASPAAGARGAGNVVYPAFGTGLAASVGEHGPQAELVSFSSREHTVGGEPAPMEAWQRAPHERGAGPGAHWIEKNALRALKLSEMDGGDYLSANWPAMSKRLGGDGVGSLNRLVSDEAQREQAGASRQRGSSGAVLEPGLKALDRVLWAQKHLMSALEGRPAGEPGVFELAAAAWAERKEKERVKKEKAAAGGQAPLSQCLTEIEAVGKAALEVIAAKVWPRPSAQQREKLDELERWLTTELPRWRALPEGGLRAWPMEAVDRFKEQLAAGGLLADGKRALEAGEGIKSARGWDALSQYASASIYAALFPPAAKGGQREREMEKLQDWLSDLQDGFEEALKGVANADHDDLLSELSETSWEVMSACEGKSYASLAPRQSAASKEAAVRGEAEQEAGWRGIEQLLSLADQCLLEAAGLARGRELAALESMGLRASADLAREDESGERASLGLMAVKERRRRAAGHADALTRALSLHGQMFWNDDDETPMEYAAKAHGGRSGSKAEMEAFFKSPMGAVYAEMLEALSDAGADSDDEPRALALYQACLQEFRDPSGEGHPLSARPMGPEVKESLLSFLRAPSQSGRTQEEREAQERQEQMIDWLSDTQEAATTWAWGRVFTWLGADEGVDFALARAKEAERQCPIAARWLVEGALGREPRDPKPQERDDRPLKRGDHAFTSLPYGYGPDAPLRARGMSSMSEAGDFEDPEVAALLKAEGFAGEAALAAKLCYERVEMREGADARSRANAWLAAGKRLCKEELGLTEGAYQAARAHEAGGKRLASLLPRVVKSKLALREKRRELEQAGALESGPDLSQSARRALRLSGLFAAALSRSMDPSRAYVAAEAIEPGKASSGEIDLTTDYMDRAMGAMSSGLSRSEALAGVRRELKARAALSERLDAALLERAGELLKEHGKTKKTAAAAERAAIEELRNDLGRVNDWADDNAGAFFTRLPPKLLWAHLRRGEQEWHEEVILREAGSQQGWEPALGSWEAPGGEWTAEELVTAEALSREGSAMRHCVGSYSSQCRSGASRIFSIKKNGVRALTAQFESSSARSVNGRLEVAPTEWRLAQNKGPCNAEPTKEGAKITKALQEALRESWALRVEEKVKKAIESIGEVRALAGPADFEVPGFNPDAKLDVSKLRRAGGKEAEAEPAAKGKAAGKPGKGRAAAKG